MSRLEELLQEYCPDGVEYKKLFEIAEYSKSRVDASALNESNYVGVENLLPNKEGKTVATTYPTEGKAIAFVKNDILIGNIRPYLKKIWLASHDGGTNGDVLVVHIVDRSAYPKFAYYALSSDKFFHYDMQNAKGSKMPRGDKKSVMEYEIPVPPLPVQREIVRILDEYTKKIKELNESLTAELTARKKQYDYFKSKMLATTQNSVWMAIPEFSYTYIGLVTTMTKHYVTAGVPLIHNSDIKNNRFEFKNHIFLDEEFALKNRSRVHKTGDVITVHTGDVGTSAIINDELDGSLGFATIATRINDPAVILPEWLCHCLNSDICKNQIYNLIKGDRNNLNLKDFNRLRVPVPSLTEQKKIIEILSAFDVTFSSISQGLPAEIAARQAQYEFYRDKLLTFDKRNIA